MKNKYILIIFIVGFIVTILGSLFKITHMEIGVLTGNIVITIGMLSQILAGMLFIYKLLSNKKDSFLNK
ncbi:gliding motility protein GldL [Flavobacterium sp.]|uniref:gliding motility protein GldL n=1 Tax=Flavobacterium sp. TaxID=239 RepID=UPI00286E63CD|nr:gliding motility protein GldL [Flavobacterium sp.]